MRKRSDHAGATRRRPPGGSSGCRVVDQQEVSPDTTLEMRMGLVAHKILVLSGKGGVGKSTVAVNLAVALADAGARVGLLDADLHGPSVPTLLGLVGRTIPVEGTGDYAPVSFSERLEVMSLGFFLPHHDDAVIWRGPRRFSAVKELLARVSWGALDALVIDAPPGTGDEPLAVAELLPGADGAVIVSTPQAVAVTDVRKAITFCRELDVPVLGVIENMSGFACPQCGVVSDVFRRGGAETMAGVLGVPFLGRVPIDPLVVVSGDEGVPYLSGAEGTVADAFREAFAPLIARVLELSSRIEGAQP
jgi:ATP-binding protein involved in chromosome partitioning